MTIPDHRPWVDRYGSRVALLCIIGTCMCFVGLGYQQFQIRAQASQGARAREIQQQRSPVSVKLAEDAQRRGVISADELTCFETGRHCLPPVKTP